MIINKFKKIVLYSLLINSMNSNVMEIIKSFKSQYSENMGINILSTVGLIGSIYTVKENIDKKKTSNNKLREIWTKSKLNALKKAFTDYAVPLMAMTGFWYNFCNPNFKDSPSILHAIKNTARENKTCTILSALGLLSTGTHFVCDEFTNSHDKTNCKDLTSCLLNLYNKSWIKTEQHNLKHNIHKIIRNLSSILFLYILINNLAEEPTSIKKLISLTPIIIIPGIEHFM